MKKCSRCKKDKSLDNYTKNNARKDKLNETCRDCHRKYTRKHYQQNKQYYKDKANNHKKKLRKAANSAKNAPCMDCEKKWPTYVMDFDHRDPKKKSFTISNAIIKSNVSVDRLLEEILKCDVVCSNCHRIRTYASVA